jgi:PRTRC genetic system protein C
MALNVKSVKRQFKFKVGGKEQTLDDPNPEFTPEEVMAFFANTYAELTTGTVSGPTVTDKGALYEFKTTIGTKG